MSGPGPGETHRACITIVGPKTKEEIKQCMNEIRQILARCGGELSQENLRDPMTLGQGKGDPKQQRP